MFICLHHSAIGYLTSFFLQIPDVEDLHDAVQTYMRTILSNSVVSFLYGAVQRKTTKDTFDVLSRI